MRSLCTSAVYLSSRQWRATLRCDLMLWSCARAAGRDACVAREWFCREEMIRISSGWRNVAAKYVAECCWNEWDKNVQTVRADLWTLCLSLAWRLKPWTPQPFVFDFLDLVVGEEFSLCYETYQAVFRLSAACPDIAQIRFWSHESTKPEKKQT